LRSPVHPVQSTQGQGVEALCWTLGATCAGVAGASHIAADLDAWMEPMGNRPA